MVTMKEFKELWDARTDKERIELLELDPEIPRYMVFVDNDDVYLAFKDDTDGEYICNFDEFGYYLIPILFNVLEIPCDFV